MKLKMFLLVVFGILLLSFAGLAVAQEQSGQATTVDSELSIVLNDNAGGVQVNGVTDNGERVNVLPASDRVSARIENARQRVAEKVAIAREKISSKLELPREVAQARQVVLANIKEKCGNFKGKELQICVGEIRQDVFEQNVQGESEFAKKKRLAYEQSVVHHLIAETQERNFLGKACSQLISSGELSNFVESEQLVAGFHQLFKKYSLTEERKEKLEDSMELTVVLQNEQGAETVVVDKAVVLPLLLPVLEKDSPLLQRCTVLVKAQRESKESEFKEAKKEFVAKWKEFKEGQSEEVKKSKLRNAVQTLCTARMKIAEKLIARGANAEKVKNFLSVMGEKCNEAASAETFEKRKEILRELNSGWRLFVKDMSRSLIYQKIEVQVSKLKSVISRANEAIDALEESGVNVERIAFARTVAASAEEATGAVLEKDSLRAMVKKVFIARAKVKRLVYVVNKIKNGADPAVVTEEQVSDEVVASVPEVEVDPEQVETASEVASSG